MTKKILMLMLLASITTQLCAQSTSSDKYFEVPRNIIFNRSFSIDLGSGNRAIIDLTDITDLTRLTNIDSVLQVFFDDVKLLKDSFDNPLSAKRIDYMTDQFDRKKIRFRQSTPRAASFLLSAGELASLRTEQDSVFLVGILNDPPEPEAKISKTNARYYRLSFYLNQFGDLEQSLQSELRKKINTISTDVNGKWSLVLGTASHYLKSDRSITADKKRGYTNRSLNHLMTLKFSVNAQNYKQFFVPSFTLGTRFNFTNRDRNFKWQPGLAWEPHFIFAKDANDRVRTYRNDFITLTYAQGGTTDYDPKKEFAYSANFLLSYLVYRQGDYFERGTFRFGGGAFSVYKTSIEPSLYFNDFFRGVTPCIRLVQYF